MIVFVSAPENKLAAVKVVENKNKDNNNNNNNDDNNKNNDDKSTLLFEIIQIVDPVVRKIPSGVNPKKGPWGGTLPPIATEWIIKHPKYPLLYALTSFWNVSHAILTTYKINDNGNNNNNDVNNNNDNNNLLLQKIGSTKTGGYQACQGIFSHDGTTLVVAHHNGGKLSFFDTSQPNIAIAEPLLVMEAPCEKPKNINEHNYDIGLPTIHGISYAPNGKYLIGADPRQNSIFTIPVHESNGRPIMETKTITITINKNKKDHDGNNNNDNNSNDFSIMDSDDYQDSNNEDDTSSSTRTMTKTVPAPPISVLTTTTKSKTHGWIFYIAAKIMLGGGGPRPRRVVVHPNGQYVYVLFEATNYIQVYRINESGKIIVDNNHPLLQEISILDSDKGGGWTVVITPAEMIATNDGLYVSIRGMSLLSSSKNNKQVEYGIRKMNYLENGAKLQKGNYISGVAGPVRHFEFQKSDNNNDEILWVGINSPDTTLLQKFVKNQTTNEYELHGQTNVGMDVFCVASMG